MNAKGNAGIGATHAVRRGDQIRVPLEYLAKDPVKLAFGLGIGNASHSNLGEQFTGDYYDLFQFFAVLTVSTVMLELGLLGLGILFLIYAMLFFDSIAVARQDKGLLGTISAGFIGVMPAIGAATFYTSIHTYTMLSFLFWYFAGMVAARRTELAKQHSAEVATAMRSRWA
jgi:hypothetical protein